MYFPCKTYGKIIQNMWKRWRWGLRWTQGKGTRLEVTGHVECANWPKSHTLVTWSGVSGWAYMLGTGLLGARVAKWTCVRMASSACVFCRPHAWALIAVCIGEWPMHVRVCLRMQGAQSYPSAHSMCHDHVGSVPTCVGGFPCAFKLSIRVKDNSRVPHVSSTIVLGFEPFLELHWWSCWSSILILIGWKYLGVFGPGIRWLGPWVIVLIFTLVLVHRGYC